MPISRRRFAKLAALAAVLPRGVHSQSAPARIVVRPDSGFATIRPEFHGHFAEHLGSCVYGGLWVGPNSPIPNIDGYRKQAVEYLKELGIPVLRWPGGCFADDYHWRDGIGPREKRPKRVNIHWGNYVEDNSFGIHEFIGLCRVLGSDPYIAGNVGSGTPAELRDWVEYCNYPKGSTLADERAANGSPNPFRVRYWGVGNENWGCGGNMSPEYYAGQYKQFASYVRNFGETRNYLIACGPNGNDVRWARGFLDTVGNRLPNGLAMHFYQSGTQAPLQFDTEAMNTQFAKFAAAESAIVQQRALLDGYDPQRRVGLLLDEWGVWDRLPREDEERFGKLWQQSTMRSAIGAALGLNIFNRQADKLVMCNIAQIVNVLQSLLLTEGPEGKECIRTTSYYAFELFKAHRAKMALRVDSEGTGPLDLSVSASRNGADLVITLVNPKLKGDISVDCAIRGMRASKAQARILHNADWNAFNGFDHPNTVVPREHAVRLDDERLRVDAPGLSIVTIRAEIA